MSTFLLDPATVEAIQIRTAEIPRMEAHSGVLMRLFEIIVASAAFMKRIMLT